MTAELKASRQDATLILTLSNPGAKNALHPDMYAAAVESLERSRRIITLPIAGTRRYVAVEDAARYRDALGVPLPQGLPEALLEPVRDPSGDLVLRYARSHAPFTARELAARFGLGPAIVDAIPGFKV